MGSSNGSLGLFLLVITMLILSSLSQVTARKFYVGGKKGWILRPSETYNHWAERNRFQVNDTLYFKYYVGSDSVLVVKKEDYDSCNTSNPLHNMDDGDSEFRLDKSGPFFFISGKVENCKQGQKLIVVVMAIRENKPWSPSPPKASAPTAPWTPAGPPAWTPSSSSSPPPSVIPSSGSSPSAWDHSPAPAPAHHSGGTRFGVPVGAAVGIVVGVVFIVCSFV